ncbi:MAG: BatA domain-containing protein, partial [Pirellulales bacterium]|nr:BatA domain-containing protein [Pirellulales bacterium]
MTFVSAAFLFAALAGAIPVVLHMINRQQAKNLPFSTLRFLRISAEKTRRRKRIHDLLLMLLRVAVLILLAFGLAEPTLTSLSHFWGNGSTAVAILLDNSASMGVIDEGRPRFETARDAARQILGELGDGDQVVLMLTGGPKLDNQERLQTAHDKVLQAIDQAAVSYERAELAEKLRDAENLLARTETQNKQIYVLTDMQQLSWEGLKERAQKPADAERADHPGEQVPLIVVDCNRNPKPNVAVTGLELKAVVPVAGLPITAMVELFNAASAPQKRHAELYVDGAKTATSPELEMPPGERLAHGFQFVLEQGGMHRGELRIVGDDGSRYDDQRYFSL